MEEKRTWFENIAGFFGIDNIRESLVSSPPAVHRPQYDWQYNQSCGNFPPYQLWHSRVMVQDPVVRFGLDVRNAAITAGQVEVDSESEELTKWVGKQWDHLWGLYSRKLLKAKRWGSAAFRLTFKEDNNGWLSIDGLEDFSPRDVRPIVYQNSPAGFKLRGTVSEQEYVYAPRGLWVTFDAEFGSVYGKSILCRCYEPWVEKWMDHGAKKVSQLRMIKDAYRGDVAWYPMDKKITLKDGTELSWHDVMREQQENALAGATMTLPMIYDREGRKMVDYIRAKDTGNPQGIWEWADRLDRDIWRGLSVFEEVIQAASSGSGYSGRSIPLIMFVQACQVELDEIVECIDRDVMRPLAWMNMGREPDYRMRAVPLIDTFVEKTQDSQMGGGGMGGVPGQQQAAPGTGQQEGDEKPGVDGSLVFKGGRWIKSGNEGALGQGNAPQQFGDFKEDEHPRKGDGKFTDGAGEGPSKDQAGTKPTKAKQTDSPEFKAWFGDSKVVDDAGQPVVVYHGTSADFEQFELDAKTADNVKPIDSREGLFFASSAEQANLYAGTSEGANIKPVYLSLQNPIVIDRPSDVGHIAAMLKAGKKNGRDGAIIKYHDGDHYVIFEPTQAKSSSGNRGTFDPNEPNITFSEQFAEVVSTLGDDIIEAGAAAARSGTAELSAAIAERIAKAKDLDDPQLMADIAELIRLHEEEFQATLADSLIAAEVAGNVEAAQQMTATAERGLNLPPGGPDAPASLGSLSPGEESVRFPTVDDALNKVNDSPVFVGANMQETADAVRQGAFAITGDLTDETVNDIRTILSKNVEEGMDANAFRDDVQAMFGSGSSGLSDARVNLVFRTNVQAALSDATERAVSAPLLAERFPYRRYRSTTGQRVRPEHFQLTKSGLDGTNIYNAKDPAWTAFRPPWAYNCRCSGVPVTVTAAARAGVKEAKDWLKRAQAMADEKGGVAQEWQADTKPPSFQFVAWPTLKGEAIQPDPRFIRDSQQFAEFKEEDHPRKGDGEFTVKGGGEAGGKGDSKDDKFERLLSTKSESDAEAFRAAKADGIAIPPAWTAVEYFGKDENVRARGRDAKGRVQVAEDPKYRQRISDANNARISKDLTPRMDELRATLKDDAAGGSVESQVLYLIALTGFRIGGRGDGRAKVQAFGASTIQGEHVTIDGDTVTFDFPGKKGVRQQHTVTDSVVADMVRGAKDGEPIFDTRDTKVRKAWQDQYGGAKVHDIRHVVATELAQSALADAVPPQPKTAAARKSLIKSIATQAGSKLGNNPSQALGTYIDPHIWDRVKVAA